MKFTGNPREVKKIASGWAAYGDGWAVHAPTRKAVLEEYKKEVEFYLELEKRPVRYADDTPRRGKERNDEPIT